MAVLETILGNISVDSQFAIMLRDNAYNVVLVAAVIMALLVAYAILAKPRKEKIKKALFIGIAGVAVLSTLYLAGSTVYLNIVSPTGGPVHWHTDYEVWHCGNKLDLIDPTGIDNRVGTWEVHEHNDDRMHIEGTIVDLEQASFRHFFEIIGTKFSDVGLTYPTVSGNVTLPYAGACNGKHAELQAFLLRVTNPQDAKQWVYEQQKIPISLETRMQPYANVPPGDCLIVEYDEVKARTAHSCASYRAAMNRGELHGR
ncbi:MAG: hypothetical protein IPJ89_00625 [Candidatus Iainarchaeum archaeon]|uniref:Uncharacterized protein n=1 Tax=Candidatus Iainarchaeum sp. TaxID=3101447 RepID=A0A7T9DJZ5_9ARCH|nr:MAG: hypothetical protein IPJ89_00625 [Candidatus Diapherotrites archaeon]